MKTEWVEWEPGFDTTAPGPVVVTGMPDTVYHQMDRASASRIAPWTVDDHEGAMALENESITPTMDMRFGTALHYRLLEPKEFYRRVIVREDIGPSAIKTLEKVEAENPDSIVLVRGWKHKLEQIRLVAGRHPVAQRLMFSAEAREAHRELTLLWTEYVYGGNVLCKARIDYWHPVWSCIIDIKSTVNARRSEFERTIAAFHYHTKAAWYVRAVQQTGLHEDPRFGWLAVERTAPYRIAAHAADERCIAQGWGEACQGLHALIGYIRRGREVSPFPDKFTTNVDLPTYKRIDPDAYTQFITALNQRPESAEPPTWKIKEHKESQPPMTQPKESDHASNRCLKASSQVRLELKSKA